MSRFVKPETCVLTLKNGDTLIVKKRLNRGEKAAMFSAMRGPGDEGFNPAAVGLARVLAYLIDWNLQDENTPLRNLSDAERTPILNSLDPEFFREVVVAIDEHEEKVQAEIDAAKKAHAGETASPAISSSPSSSDSATSGSASSTPTSTT